jgi:hypothetical protein
VVPALFSKSSCCIRMPPPPILMGSHVRLGPMHQSTRASRSCNNTISVGYNALLSTLSPTLPRSSAVRPVLPWSHSSAMCAIHGSGQFTSFWKGSAAVAVKATWPGLLPQLALHPQNRCAALLLYVPAMQLQPTAQKTGATAASAS